MSDTITFKEKLEIIAEILFKCFLMGFGIMLLVFVMTVLFQDFVYQIHSKMYDITLNQFQVIIYSVMTGFKTLIIMFFVLPWIAIKLTLKKMK